MGFSSLQTIVPSIVVQKRAHFESIVVLCLSIMAINKILNNQKHAYDKQTKNDFLRLKELEATF